MRLARATSDAETTAALKRACAEWNAALADGTHASRQKRRKLCSDHEILCNRDADKNAETAARLVRSVLAQRLQALLQHVESLDQYFVSKPGNDDAVLESPIRATAKKSAPEACTKKSSFPKKPG